GGVPASYIAKWNGTEWSALGTGMGARVNALVISGADLYAGGEFYTAGGVPANRVAKWDGSNWSEFGSGLNNRVMALAVSGTNMYVGGVFTGGVGKWNGTSWTILNEGGLGFTSPVLALAASGNE